MTTPTRFAIPTRRLLALVALGSLTACAGPFAPYAVSSANVGAIRTNQRGIELGDFTGQQTSASCRLRRLGPDGGRTFAQYLRGAFNDEIVIANPPNMRQPSMLTVKVTDVSVSCGNIWSSWTIEGEVRISDRPPFNVKVERDFDGSFFADVVWTRANQAFMPTAQEFITAIVTNPVYRSEFGAPPPAPPAPSAAAPAAATPREVAPSEVPARAGPAPGGD